MDSDRSWNSRFFGIVGIILWILERRKSEKRKELTYQILSDTPIASIKQSVKDQVELRFQGKKVEDINLVVLKLRNVGGSLSLVV